MKAHSFKLGDTVKLKRGIVKLAPLDVRNYRTAKIVCFLDDVVGGVRLDRHMGGFSYWNVLDLEPVTSATPAGTSESRKSGPQPLLP